MSLSALIRKREIATATVATPATPEQTATGTVANVACVAVAKAPAPNIQQGSQWRTVATVAGQLLAEEETTIREWLAHIEETDPAAIADALSKCAANPVSRAYCLEQAKQVPPAPAPETDYTATCSFCQYFQRIDHANLGHCAKGEPEAPVGLWDTDLRWCKSFSPDKQEVSRS